MVGDGTWLTIGEVIARLRAAGFTESESTVRRMIDDGVLVSRRTERGGHRRVTAASAGELIRRWSQPDGELPPDQPSDDGHDDDGGQDHTGPAGLP